MNRDIYIKSRRRRYARILKNSFLNIAFNNIRKLLYTNSWHHNIVFFILLIVIPIYPTLASFTYDSNRYDFIRNDIDESSIIWSYMVWEDWTELEWSQDTPIIEASDSFLSINTILNDDRDLAWTNEIVNYEIKPWDSISSIAMRFKVSNNSIYWANDFSKSHIIHPGDVIKVPPTSWLIHQIKKNETISSISKFYWIDAKKILEQNLLTYDDNIRVWDVLVIPWAIKVVEKPVIKNNWKTYAKNTWNKKNNTWYNFAKWAASEYVEAIWEYSLVRRKPLHKFYWWNCTRYVSQYKNVNWSWDANEWLENAAAAWHSTWGQPSLWAIIVFNGRWYNPRYGHVWIVTWIEGWNVIVSDMNYRRLNEVTYRKVPKTDRAIQWYIYVD